MSNQRISVPDDGNHGTQWLTVDDVALRLAMSRPFVYRAMESGELPFVKMGRSRRIKAGGCCGDGPAAHCRGRRMTRRC